jgi:hypothetical protein
MEIILYLNYTILILDCPYTYRISVRNFVIKNVASIILTVNTPDNLCSSLSKPDCTSHSIFNPITIYCGSADITL